MGVDCTLLSDCHGFYPKLEGGDLLIVAGDLTAKDTLECYRKWYQWIGKCKYKKIIVISGNHDSRIQEKGFPPMPKSFNIEYLCDSGTEFEYEEPVRNLFDPEDKSLIFKSKLKIWGSPWTLTFEGMNPHCKAFCVDTEEELAEKWALIPDHVDILITHSPPFTILDKTIDGRQVGSTSLMAEHLARLRPKLWVWGHVHEAYGESGPYQWNNTKYVNASHVNENYEPVNKPVRILL